MSNFYRENVQSDSDTRGIEIHEKFLKMVIKAFNLKTRNDLIAVKNYEPIEKKQNKVKMEALE